MTFIDFKIDEEELAENLKNDIPNLDFTLFVMSIFMMPIRMQINGLDLFKYKDDPWSEATLLGIASSGLLTFLNLKKSGKEYWVIIEGPGDIEFTMMDDNNVKVDFNSGSRHAIVTVKYDELLDAFKKFADKVREFIWERVPQLNDHPYWGPWLRGERD